MIDGSVTGRVALVTCAELPGLDSDDRLIIPPLEATGINVDAVVWDDRSVGWAGYDLVVLRSTWDYVRRRDAFIAWASQIPHLANPVEVVTWNTDKRYLADLAAARVATVTTRWFGPGDAAALPEAGEWVVKPAVGAGSLDAGRYDLADSRHRELASAHVARMTAAGRVAMVQPYLAAVDTEGETAVLYLGGNYSHAVRKGPMLPGPEITTEGLYRPEEITPREASPAELDLAAKALAVVPGGPLLYARVDLIPGPDGEPLVVEVELTEPSLYLGTAAGAAQRFADAITSLVR